MSTPTTRRAVLRGGGAMAIAVLVPLGGAAAGSVAVPIHAGAPAFLSAAELKTLRALVDRFIPGQPEDLHPGAVAGGCPEAIDALLGAFRSDPPRIYAGAPFSDRAGSPVNHFEDFLPLDAYETRAWRLRIEGSGGRPELEFNGPVKGFQAVYRTGLAALDKAAGPLGFAVLPGPARDLLLKTTQDAAVKALVDIAVPHTLEFMYGAPEYGGNRDLVGWNYTNWAGDVQPRGWTREQVEQPDDLALPLPALPVGLPTSDLLALAALSSSEAVLGILARSGGSLSALQAELARIADGVKEAGHGA